MSACVRRASMMFALASSTSVFSHSAYAQSSMVEKVLPTVTFNDSNGVDLRSGRYRTIGNSASIGDQSTESASGIDVSTGPWTLESSGTVPLSGAVYQSNIDRCPGGTNFQTGCYVELIARLGQKEINFGWQGSFPRTSPAGAKIDLKAVGQTFQYSVSERNGKVWNFNANGGLSSIVFPDGSRYDYYYPATSDGTASVNIVSSSGYQLRAEKGTRKIALINMKFKYCNPQSAVCDIESAAWPTIGNSQISLGKDEFFNPLGYKNDI